MYRVFTRDELIKHITIYKCENPQVIKDITKAKPFFDNPSLGTLMNILVDASIDKTVKSSILSSLNTTLNYTSVKELLNSRSDLLYLLENVDIKPIYTYEQVKAITSYIINKSKNTNAVSGLQIEDVEKKLKLLGCDYQISKNGFTDFKWGVGSSSAKADGIINHNNEEIILYLRYGSSHGGAQNDRYRGMFDTVRANPSRKFIYICDGPEAFLQYQLAKENIDDGTCKNGLWVTAKLLRFIDLEEFKILTT